MNQNVSITCALTGGSDSTGKNPHVPVTPAEIAKAADEAARAGASMVHIHVRDPETGKESWDKKYFIDRIEFIGNTTTRDYVLRRELGVREEELFNLKEFIHVR